MKPRILHALMQQFARWIVIIAIWHLTHDLAVAVLAAAISTPYIAGDTAQALPRHDVVRITSAGDVKWEARA